MLQIPLVYRWSRGYRSHQGVSHRSLGATGFGTHDATPWTGWNMEHDLAKWSWELYSGKRWCGVCFQIIVNGWYSGTTNTGDSLQNKQNVPKPLLFVLFHTKSHDFLTLEARGLCHLWSVGDPCRSRIIYPFFLGGKCSCAVEYNPILLMTKHQSDWSLKSNSFCVFMYGALLLK